MSFDSHPDAKLNTYGGEIVQNKSGKVATGLVESMMSKRLLAQLSESLATDAIEFSEDKYAIKARLRVYVLTPSQLEKYVSRRAMEIHPGLPSARFIEEPKDFS